ncbi:ABC transporter permease [Clostridium sp.]|uniref:ABC transporter permease n=1 Tax=Clostridium sp. TaxID=1506 RepID=UPI00346449CF
MLWGEVYGEKGNLISGLTLNNMIWYLIITEIITLSRSQFYLQVSEDVKSGSIAYGINKPYNYVIYCFFNSLGEMSVRLISNMVLGLIIGIIFVGPLEEFKIITLPFIILSILVGTFINFFIYIILALTSFWVEENKPFFWIYSKLIFTLGGMLIPLDLFPGWLKQISSYLPFAYITYVPGKLAVDFSIENFYKGFLIQGLYLFLFIVIALAMYRKGAEKLNVNGG